MNMYFGDVEGYFGTRSVSDVDVRWRKSSSPLAVFKDKDFVGLIEDKCVDINSLDKWLNLVVDVYKDRAVESFSLGYLEDEGLYLLLIHDSGSVETLKYSYYTYYGLDEVIPAIIYQLGAAFLISYGEGEALITQK